VTEKTARTTVSYVESTGEVKAQRANGPVIAVSATSDWKWVHDRRAAWTLD